MKEKTAGIMHKIMYIVTPVALVVLLGLNIFTMARVKALEDSTTDDSSEDVAQENDVTIGSEYVIKATTQISDAYKSGDTSKLSDTDKETLDMAKDVLDAIITDGMSDYEKELAVYKWMCENIGFDDGSLSVIPDENDLVVDNPHGVLQTHKAVCVGYATTFRLFMQMLGIDCMVVHDSYLSHSWDLVKLDGQWYHTDVYSDADSKGNFAHFNLDDSTMMSSQDWNTDFFPAADGIKYNYAYMNRVECKDIYSIPAQVRAAIDAKNGIVSLDMGKDMSDDTYTVVETIMEQIQNAVAGDSSITNLYWSWMSTEDGDNIFCTYISYYSDDDDNGGGTDTDTLDTETQQKINDAVNKSFSDIMTDSYNTSSTTMHTVTGGSCGRTAIG